MVAVLFMANSFSCGVLVLVKPESASQGEKDAEQACGEKVFRRREEKNLSQVWDCG